MRKITKQIVASFNDNKSLSIDNSEVIANGAIVSMYLFGHLIAEKNIDTGIVRITNANYFTNTTKERLNGLPNVSICQKKGKWYLNGSKWDGKWIKVN